MIELRNNDRQIVWTYLWSEIPDVPTSVAKGVYVPTAKRKVLGMFSSSASGKVIFLYDEQQKKYLLAQCQRLMSRWHEAVEGTSADWLREFFLLVFDYRTALLTLAYHFNLHHLTPRGFRWLFKCIYIYDVICICNILAGTLCIEDIIISCLVSRLE